jgi:hypothetical protein
MDDVAAHFPEPGHGTKQTLVRLVGQMLERGVPAGRIRDALVTNLGGVNDLGAVWITRLERVLTPVTSPRRAVPPPCGQCDWRPGDGFHTRVLFLDNDREKSIPCPRCHPDALAGAADIA